MNNNSLHENMRRFGTKNLGEQILVADTGPDEPAAGPTVSNVPMYANNLANEISKLAREWEQKYYKTGQLSKFTPEQQKKIVRGMIAKVDASIKLYQTVIREIDRNTL